ncbi:MAG: hypothetical protein ACE5KV_01400, partial [Thermoplasmata archaeon]
AIYQAVSTDMRSLTFVPDATLKACTVKIPVNVLNARVNTRLIGFHFLLSVTPLTTDKHDYSSNQRFSVLSAQ